MPGRKQSEMKPPVHMALLGLMVLSGATEQHPNRKAPITDQEIVQRYIAARGGLEKIKSIRTLVLKGPARPNGKPGRQMIRARPYYFTIGTEGNDGSPWEGYDEYGLRARVTDAPGAAL